MCEVFCVLCFQIDVISDLPVGDNVQNQPFYFPTEYYADLPVLTAQKIESLTEYLKYLLFGTGEIRTGSKHEKRSRNFSKVVERVYSEDLNLDTEGNTGSSRLIRFWII